MRKNHIEVKNNFIQKAVNFVFDEIQAVCINFVQETVVKVQSA
jgi:hypothetical protein